MSKEIAIDRLKIGSTGNEILAILENLMSETSNSDNIESPEIDQN